MTPELTTVADDEAVLFDGPEVTAYIGLEPDTVYELEGVEVRTLPRPPGELLCRFATVNDVHFGETECGIIEGLDAGPVLSVPEGATPYPELMNRAAVPEIAAIEPAAVLAKGDLTAAGRPEEYAAFLDCWSVFGERLHHVRGNHDGYHAAEPFGTDPVLVDLPGVRLAMIDTTRPGHAGGTVTAEQLEWLDRAAADADRPVLVFGHHHPWSPDDPQNRPSDYFGIDPDASEALVALIARRPLVRGYFAGHTHRNRVRRVASTGNVPYVEVACVKDFPGMWAEYRVFEGGILQVGRRISAPEALAWSDRCRAIYGNVLDYAAYALGPLDHRCFTVTR
ncbi:MAG: metallophosphoesterase [Acidimicrobiales bacterium]|nr:metallophosphoesterase [Acidimicrobiales bacterium]